MHLHRRVFLAAALATVLFAREATGEPILHIKTPSTLKTEGGSELRLPPGYFLDEEAWRERDLELKRLQESDVRLRAENRSLRKSAEADAIPWKTIGCAIVFGAFVGVIGWQMR